jgi:NAD(P)-dependent dehydrogenase (short-subunit alcohol dehydrogenase family)
METRTALVTGAAQGLGQEFAVALAGRGYRVAGLDLVPQRETADRIVDYNAGVYPESAFEDTTPEEWRRVMRVNLEAPFLLTRAVLPYLKAAGWGRIVNIASAAVLTAPPTMVAYTASKAGLIGFTRALASALGPYDITVNAIAPSMVRTETAERTVGADGGFEHVRAQQAVPRTQEPSDLVSTLLYVVDEGSGFLTGQTLNVAGGSAYL